MSPCVSTARRKARLPAFSLIELLVVISILMILAGITVSGVSDSSLNARQTSREIIKNHLQQARAHALATRKLTALIIPVRNSKGKAGLHAISLIEVEQINGEFVANKNENGDALLSQRWTTLPQNFHFVTNGMSRSDLPTVVDHEKTLTISQRGQEMECHIIVFAPNGQINYPLPGAPIHIAIAQIARHGNTLRINQISNHEPVFDLLVVNRLTARTRSITP